MKKVVIDGHNLIPKVGGISLSDPEDENKLTAMVSEYCRLARVRVEIFFDGAPPGQKSASRRALVNIHHVRQGHTADDAILMYLRKEGANARNLLVVSSDRRVQTEARGLRAEVMTSEQFSDSMRSVFSSPRATQELRERAPTVEEVDEMLKLMTKNDHENQENPCI